MFGGGNSRGMARDTESLDGKLRDLVFGEGK